MIKEENIEQEIYSDFKSLSESNLMEMLSYSESTSHFELKYSDRTQLIHTGLNKKLEDDEDYRINNFLASCDFNNVNWVELIKLYPHHTPIALQIPQNIYPLPKFRSKLDRINIDNFIKLDWDNKKQVLHSKIPNEKIGIDYLIDIRWGGIISCPRCGGTRIYTLNSSSQYKCAKCTLKFTEKLWTIFQNSNLSLLKWYEAIYLLMSLSTRKISTPQLSLAINVPQKTAWLMCDRIKNKISDDFLKKITYKLYDIKTKTNEQ